MECLGNGHHRWHRMTADQYNSEVSEWTASELQWSCYVSPMSRGCRQCEEELRSQNPKEWTLRAAHEKEVHIGTKECAYDAKVMVESDWNTRSKQAAVRAGCSGDSNGNAIAHSTQTAEIDCEESSDI